MKIAFIFTGKTTESWIQEACHDYIKRIKRYIAADIVIIPSVQHALPDIQKKKESESILKKISGKDVVVLLDERGKQLTSPEFAVQLNAFINSGKTRVVFITGGAYGVDKELQAKADVVLSLSKMTFTHQMVRPTLLEQVYRAFTILKNQKYHH